MLTGNCLALSVNCLSLSQLGGPAEVQLLSLCSRLSLYVFIELSGTSCPPGDRPLGHCPSRPSLSQVLAVRACRHAPRHSRAWHVSGCKRLCLPGPVRGSEQSNNDAGSESRPRRAVPLVRAKPYACPGRLCVPASLDVTVELGMSAVFKRLCFQGPARGSEQTHRFAHTHIHTYITRTHTHAYPGAILQGLGAEQEQVGACSQPLQPFGFSGPRWCSAHTHTRTHIHTHDTQTHTHRYIRTFIPCMHAC